MKKNRLRQDRVYSSVYWGAPKLLLIVANLLLLIFATIKETLYALRERQTASFHFSLAGQ